MAVFDDLAAEQDRLEQILNGLSEADWMSPSAAEGWTVCDVVLHLAQGEEIIPAIAAGTFPGFRTLRESGGRTVDQVMDDRVRAERAAPAEVFRRWREARVAALATLRAADPRQTLDWVERPLKPATMATTRLAEHWAHGLDIAGPLGLSFPDTGRLRNVAWLAYRTLPYSFALTGESPPEVYCELTAPDGAGSWQFGSPDAESAITGPAGAFCRVAAQRLAPGQSGLRATGPNGPRALRFLRTYAA